MPRRRVRSRKNKTQQGRIATIGIEVMRTRDEWSRLVNEWNGTCAYCGKKPSNGDKLTRDHVIPIVAGGADDSSNIVPACKPCNEEKGAQFWQPLLKPAERKTPVFHQPNGGMVVHEAPSPPRRRPRSKAKIPGAGLRTMFDALHGVLEEK